MTAHVLDGISRCPTWCIGVEDHLQGIAEGCEVESITHASGDRGMRLETLVNPYYPEQVLRECPATLRVELLQDGQPAPFGGFPVIEVEVVVGQDYAQRSVVRLTTGEARSLAAILVDYADQEDLHHNALPRSPQ